MIGGSLQRYVWAIWPGIIAHELTHAAAATLCPGTAVDGIEWWPRPLTRVVLESDVPTWAVWIVWTAPWVVGAALLVPVLSVGVPSFPSGPALVIAVWAAANVLLYLGLSVPDLLVPMRFTDGRLETAGD